MSDTDNMCQQGKGSALCRLPSGHSGSHWSPVHGFWSNPREAARINPQHAEYDHDCRWKKAMEDAVAQRDDRIDELERDRDMWFDLFAPCCTKAKKEIDRLTAQRDKAEQRFLECPGCGCCATVATLRTAVTDLLAALEAAKVTVYSAHIGPCTCELCERNRSIDAKIAEVKARLGT